MWLAAVLYDRAGEYAISHFIPRNLLTAYEREWPVGANRKRWLLSYPRGYRELIEKNAALNGQPAALEFAIVREESGVRSADGVVRQRHRPDAADGAAGGALRAGAAARRHRRCAIRRST